MTQGQEKPNIIIEINKVVAAKVRQGPRKLNIIVEIKRKVTANVRLDTGTYETEHHFRKQEMGGGQGKTPTQE